MQTILSATPDTLHAGASPRADSAISANAATVPSQKSLRDPPIELEEPSNGSYPSDRAEGDWENIRTLADIDFVRDELIFENKAFRIRPSRMGA